MKDIIELLERIAGSISGIAKRLFDKKGHSVKLRAETITQNVRLNDTKYGGWMAANIGTAAVTVYGIELQPGEGISSQSIVNMSPADLWQEPIEITVQPGGAVRLLRSIGTPIK